MSDAAAEPPPQLTAEQLARWSAMYGPEHRQIRRWIERGREQGDPCPLDNPLAMPAWIEKHLNKIRAAVRDKVNAAAAAARAQHSPSPPTASAIAPSPSAVPVSPAEQAAPTVTPLDLATVGGVEGESVDLFRRLFAAARQQIEAAYRAERPNEEQIRILHNRVEKVGESLRKHEIAAEARARRRGDLLDKSEVLNEVTQLLTTLKLMHEQMATRIVGELPGLDPATQDQLRRIILRERGRELTLLRTLSAFRSPDDLLLELAA